MERYLGLMSGTSLDGVDVALVGFEGEGERPERAEPFAYTVFPYERAFRARLRDACATGSVAELCRLNFELGALFAAAITETLADSGVDPSDIVAIGSHGQTVWHEPPAGAPGSTLQIGEAAVIAERTGIPVVADFRVRDVAAGGQGAPLTAYTDRLLFTDDRRGRAIQNLGGMGNVTALPAATSHAGPLAFDTGPGVALLDAAAQRLTDGVQLFDVDGALAAAGIPIDDALAEWLGDPFFDEPPPRSTGREHFSEGRLEAWLARHDGRSPADLLATLSELTARSIASSYRWIDFEIDEVLLCGGGSRNPELSRRIASQLAPVPVRGLESIGWDPEAREAIAFALLARQHVHGYRAGAPWATGARGARTLGKWVPG
jgi:anhydro-N-acetylmuramic acid kinase